MRCPVCDAENRDTARFCEDCGARLDVVRCPSCAAEVTAGRRFCGECGARLEEVPTEAALRGGPEGERKHVTVLFCDIVGSTALAERLGPEPMHELLNEFFALALEEVQRYGAAINKFLGDGFMALVGVPVAHEDHARRMVLAALGLRRALAERTFGPSRARVQTRMGLNSGPVVVGALGDDATAEFTAIGDTINVAARLQTTAEPGSILISDMTARLVSGYIRTEPLGIIDVRGRSKAVSAHRVTGVGPRRSPLEGLGSRPLGRFVGRERQLAALRDLLAETCAGRGQVVGVVAEPGMGKTRLVTEFRRQLRDSRITFLEGRCLSFGASVPYVPIIDIVRANCGVTDADGPREIAEKVRFGLTEVGIEPDEAAPFVLNLLAVREGVEQVASLTPEAVKARTSEVLLAMCLNGSRRRPVVFLVEDLHWMDGVSEEWFSLLVESLAGAPIMLLCTYRPGYAAPWMQRSYATQIPLPPLTPNESLEVVRWVLDRSDVPPDLADAVVARAEGNPFFVEELARALQDRDQDESAVPGSVQDVLMARVDRLADEPRRVLQTASILGRQFSVPVLTAVWSGPGALDPHLLELKRLEFVYEQSGPEGPVYVFKHALTQDVAYESLLTSRREALHEAAGEALERLYADRLETVLDRLAYHYAATPRSEKAVEYLVRFAERAVRTYAHAEAAEALREALRHAERLTDDGRDDRLIGLVMRLVYSLYFLGRFDESLELLARYEATAEQLGDLRVTGEYRFWLGHTYTHAGDHEGAERGAFGAIRAAETTRDLTTQGKAHYVLSREGFWRGQLDEGTEHGRRAVACLEGTDQWWWLGHASAWVGLNLCYAGDFEPALEYVGRMRAIGRERGDPRLQSYAAWVSGWILATRGDAEQGIADCTESLQLSPDPLNSSYSMGWLGFAYREGGDFAQAIALLERSIAMLADFGYGRLVAWFRAWLSEAYLWGGRAAEARALAEDALMQCEQLVYPWATGVAGRALGRIALHGGDLEAADARLIEATRIFEAIGARFELAVAGLGLAELASRRGDDAGAGAELEACRRRFEELNAPRYLERTTRLARELLRETPTEAG